MENIRKFSNDSLVVHTKIEGTKYILTWRVYVELSEVRWGRGEQANTIPGPDCDFMGLYNCISFEAVSEEEYRIEYDIYTISEFTAKLCQEHRRYGKEALEYPKERMQTATSFVFYPLRLENVILYMTFSNEHLQKEKILNLFDHKIFKEHFLRFTFNHGTKYIHKSNLPMLNLYTKPGYNTDYYLPSDPDPFAQAIIHGAYEVYHTRSRPYAELVQTRAPAIRTYYKQLDRNLLRGALKDLEYIERSYTAQQKDIILGSENVVFFGRSGTGKTQCCIHSLFARDLVARAIDKKLKLKFTGVEPKYTKPPSPVLKSIFITASPFLAKDVKAQFDRIKSKISLGKQSQDLELDEEAIMSSLNPSARSGELPQTFDEEGVDYPLFLSFQEFITIYYRTMMAKDLNLQRKQKEIKLEGQNDDQIIEGKIAEIVGSFGDKAHELASARSAKQLKSGKKPKAGVLKRQVDFKMYFRDFYSKKIMRDHRFKSLSSTLIWSEIRTKIKGSTFQFYKMLDGKLFDPENTEHKAKARDIYDRNSAGGGSTAMALVFEVFLLYEKWKTALNLYDIEDLVGTFYDSNISWLNPMINFDLLIIDEVQDLSFNSIQIMVNLCLNKVIICGDNAQNIDKGINFKFNDLKNFLVDSCLSKRSEDLIDYTDYEHMANYAMSLQDYYLDMNFRNSHKILRLANLPLCLLEAFFKTEIDTYPKEEGYFDGPLPKVFELGLPVDSLVQYLSESLKMESDVICSIQTGVCETFLKIGNDFCIIVRDQAAKSTVPGCFKHCVVMTLQESKGLEFEHVLLYNFFTNNENETAWRFMTSNLSIEEIPMPRELNKEEFESRNFFQRSKLQVQLLLNKEKGTALKVDSLITANSMNSQGKLDGLSSDLKFLYVAITRAKKNFIIFDEAMENESANHFRLELDKIMEKRELVKIMNKSNLSSTIEEYTPSESTLATLKQVAREKGYSLLRQGSYEAATRLFKISGDSKLIAYCTASEKARVASELLSLEFDEELKKKYKNLSTFKEEIFTSLKSAASLYNGLGKHFEAGKAYFSCEEYSEAAKSFELASFTTYQAHSLFMSKSFEQALKIYKKQGIEEMINICIMSMADQGIDISKLAWDDEDEDLAIDPSKLNDATYSVYVKDLISGYNKEIKGLSEFEMDEPVMMQVASLSQEGNVMSEDKSESFEMVKSLKEDSWCKVNSLNEEEGSEFQDIQSQVLELSRGHSFKELAESMSLHEGSNGVLDKMLNRFEKHSSRILHMILQVPGIELFGITKESTLVELLIVMSVLYRFEDVGIKLFNESQSANHLFINALAVNKMLRLDVNTLKNRMFKLPLPERKVQVAPNSIERELISLNIFDIISAFQQGPAATLSLDSIIKESFFDIITTGLSQHFLNFSNDSDLKQALSFFISWEDYMKLYERKEGDEAIHPESKEPLLLQTRLVSRSNGDDLVKELTAFFEEKEKEWTFKPSMIDDMSAAYFLERLAGLIVEARGKERLASCSIRLAGNCIKMLRYLLKRDYLLPREHRQSILQTVERHLQFKDLAGLASFTKAYSDFALLHKHSVIFEILARASKGPSCNKQLAFFAIDETDSLFIVQKEKLLNSLLLSAVYLLAEGLTFESISDVANFEMVSGITKLDKPASGLTKLFKTSSEVFFEKCQFEKGYGKAFEEQIYTFCMKVAAEKGYTEYYLTCYRYYRSLMDRIDETDSMYVAGIIKSRLVKNTKARLFQIAKEAEDSLIAGDVNQALLTMVDLEEYASSQNIRLGNVNISFVGLMRTLTLLIANCKFADPSSFGSFMNYKERLYLPRFWEKELQRMDWVVEDKGEYYLDEEAINGELVDEATFKLADKLDYNISLVSRDCLHFYPELANYLDGLLVVRVDHESKEFLTQVSSKSPSALSKCLSSQKIGGSS